MLQNECYYFHGIPCFAYNNTFIFHALVGLLIRPLTQFCMFAFDLSYHMPFTAHKKLLVGNRKTVVKKGENKNDVSCVNYLCPRLSFWIIAAIKKQKLIQIEYYL